MPPASSSQFSQNTVYDFLFGFEDGMDSGVSPLLLKRNQLAYASNLTTRGSLVHPRPVRRQYTLDLTAVPALNSALLAGTWLFQGKCYYKPDSGAEYLLAAISGNLYKFLPDPATLIVTVTDVTGGNPQSTTAVQHWLWQAEHWVIWNDGINLPVFFDGATTTRSRGSSGSQPPMYVVANPFTGIGVGTAITLTYAFVGANGDSVILSPGTGSDKLGVVASGAGTKNIVVNFAITNPSYFVAAGTQLLDTAASITSVATTAAVVITNGYDTTTSLVFNLASNYNGSANVIISNGTIFPINGVVTAGIGTPIIHIKLSSLNNTGALNLYVGPNINIAAGQLVTDATVAPQAAPLPPQFPPGRMGAYGRGRIWMALADGKQFVAGDIVGGSSGTSVENFRDAILNITENQFLVGGGNFTVPGSIGDIRAMIFTAQLDAALGQGPLMVYTPTHIFSCNAPVDRLTWQSLTNPILTESAIGNGGLGQDSTFLSNSDTFSRSSDGIRSLILSTQDFNKWVRTPISHEVERILNFDNQALLAFGQGGFFDNRILMSASPISVAQGVYHQSLVALNTDLITTVRDKAPPAYDGSWPGQNIMGLTIGYFSQVERCYQFVFNPVKVTLEVWELMPSVASDVENNPNLPLVGDQIQGTPTPIEWWFESPMLFKEQNPAARTFKQLVNGEIVVDKLVGRVDFEAWYKPDQYPCWIPWLSWSECAVQTKGNDNTKPQFRPRMGLGTPSSSVCDPSTNRPLVQGYNFQFKLVVTGQCEFVGARFAATVIPEPTFAPPNCKSVC